MACKNAKLRCIFYRPYILTVVAPLTQLPFPILSDGNGVFPRYSSCTAMMNPPIGVLTRRWREIQMDS